ncbi:MAG TPA: pyridoxal phosphate-dependent aminotransferase [Bacteroidota bacterium]|nr:pyridoxal phosphate-dependent aminotransferase [Bacteroidota bacterium]
MAAGLSAKVRDLEESATLRLTQKARALREAGTDVVALTAGEPDFATPGHIKEAARRAIDEDFTHYTANQGTAELIGAVIEKFRAENGLDYAPPEVLVSTGAKQSLFNALTAMCNPGDEVIIPAPYWVSYPAIVRLAGGVPVIAPSGESFRPDTEALRKAITPRTRALIINTPCNPTGAVYTRAETEAIAALALEAGITVVSDEIYEKMVFDGRAHLSIGALPGMLPHVVTVNGVSKSYAMTGWRIGFMGGPEEIISGAARVQGQVTNNANSIAQKATVAALRGPREPIDAMREEFQRRRDFVLRRFAPGGWAPGSPEGAMFFLIDCARWIGKTARGRRCDTAADIVEHLLEHHGVALVPGDAFGAPRHMRMSFAASMAELDRGVERILRGLEEME